MSSETDQDFRPDAEETRRYAQQRKRRPAVILFLLLVLALIAGGWWWWRSQEQQPPAPQEAPRVSAAPPAAPASTPASAGPRYPLQIPEGTAALTPADIEPALVELLGRRAVASFLETSDFPRRVVATVDNLGRASAPVAAWPVRPTPDRFLVQEQADGTVIATENATRYTPFVLLVGTLDVKRAVALYRRMYPLLQDSYRELGFGNRNFNDRVIEVIDLLLATPEPAQLPRVQLTQVKGPYQLERPWVRYQFADPALESLTAGQKILVRVGPVNERRLKHKLQELKDELLAPAPGGR